MVDVILADDEEFVRYFLKTVMESIYFKVVDEVGNGNDLFDSMQKHKPDILFLDIHMPNQTGSEFLTKHASTFPNTCIIILTATNSNIATNYNTYDNVKCFLKKDTPIEKMIAEIEKTWSKFKDAKN